MRVLIDGQREMKPIVIKTFLDGLYANYKDDLYLIHMGDGSSASDVTEEWIKKTWPGNGYRHSWNAEWTERFAGTMDYEILLLKEAKPNLIFVFAWSEGDLYPLSRVAQDNNVPVFHVGRYA